MSDEPTTPPALPPRPPAPVRTARTPQNVPSQPSWGTAPQPSWTATPQPSWGAAPQPSRGAAPPPSWTATPQPSWGAAPQPRPAASPFAAPYAVHPRGSFAEPAARRGSAAGIVALVVALLATAGASIAGAAAAFGIGTGTNAGDFESTPTLNGLGFLSPVRDWVLLGEVSFWIGTGLGIWAIIQGIVAIATGRGRTAGIVAVVVAALGPVIFVAAAAVGLTFGLDAGAAPGGGRS